MSCLIFCLILIAFFVLAAKSDLLRDIGPSPGGDAAAANATLEEKRSQLKAARNQTETFLVDILSDADGVNFHRFQNAAWTFVLGIIFLIQVYSELAMPQLDNSLLALMGISAGTYLGMKIPEPKVPTVQPAPAVVP